MESPDTIVFPRCCGNWSLTPIFQSLTPIFHVPSIAPHVGLRFSRLNLCTTRQQQKGPRMRASSLWGRKLVSDPHFPEDWTDVPAIIAT